MAAERDKTHPHGGARSGDGADRLGETGAGEGRLGDLAGRQHGVVSTGQLLSLGLSRRAISRRVSAGRLHRIHLGVYAVGHRLLSSRGRWQAAVLAGGPGAVLSHSAAASLWDLRAIGQAAIDVTVPARGRRRQPRIVIHQARCLDPRDVTSRERIPVTTVSRTLLDVAEILDRRQLERTFEQAERLRLLDLQALERMLARSTGRRGVRALGALVREATTAPPTRSELERRFLEFCRSSGLPRPCVNVLVAGMEVDAHWPAQRLVVELDGHAFHRTRAAFERDRVRDARLQLAGQRVLRITHRRLEQEPAVVAGTVRALLAPPRGGDRG